jgi:hypothetical protein
MTTNQGDSVFLSREDVQRLTGRIYFTPQIKALDQMGIRYMINGLGEPLVRRSEIEEPKAMQTRSPRFEKIAG